MGLRGKHGKVGQVQASRKCLHDYKTCSATSTAAMTAIAAATGPITIHQLPK
jgi:hypothetical protein